MSIQGSRTRPAMPRAGLGHARPTPTAPDLKLAFLAADNRIVAVSSDVSGGESSELGVVCVLDGSQAGWGRLLSGVKRLRTRQPDMAVSVYDCTPTSGSRRPVLGCDPPSELLPENVPWLHGHTRAGVQT
jgi:hypothetical protein